VHLLQIWILPGEQGLTPGYEEKTFTDAEKKNQLRLLVSPDGREDSLVIHQDVNLYASILDQDVAITHTFDEGHSGWIQIVDGEVEINSETLKAGDGAAIEETASLEIKAMTGAEFLLFDMA
jgi:hypothetical protein